MLGRSSDGSCGVLVASTSTPVGSLLNFPEGQRGSRRAVVDVLFSSRTNCVCHSTSYGTENAAGMHSDVQLLYNKCLSVSIPGSSEKNVSRLFHAAEPFPMLTVPNSAVIHSLY